MTAKLRSAAVVIKLYFAQPLAARIEPEKAEANFLKRYPARSNPSVPPGMPGGLERDGLSLICRGSNREMVRSMPLNLGRW
jgi:hypothetical protein